MKNLKEIIKKMQKISIGETVEVVLDKFKKASTIKMAIIAIVIVMLPFPIAAVVLIGILSYILFKNLKYKETKKQQCPNDRMIENISDLVIVTSEKITRNDYTLTITPKSWKSTLGKVSSIKIIYEDTNLGKRLHAYVMYVNGDKNKIILPPKAYLLETELKELVLR